MAKLSRQLYTSNKVEGLSKRQTVKQSKLEIVKDDFHSSSPFCAF
jgi:hypothetical protein